MPRYRYKCGNCEEETLVFHMMNEVYTDCNLCDSTDTLKKLLTTPIKSVKIDSSNYDSNIGVTTREYIEANREILKEEKSKAKEEVYEPF
tara:strand:+ start:84 stop:353 length:270 start_codon:yes stop_codon:yes gene_type:complete